MENICSCRQAREWGTICAHSVAVGLHHLKGSLPAADTVPSARQVVPVKESKPGLQRQVVPEDSADTALFVIFPPNVEQAIPRDKIMLCFEAEKDGRRTPLNALSKAQVHRMTEIDAKVLDALDPLAQGEVPAMRM